jgi:hypothetical protein
LEDVARLLTLSGVESIRLARFGHCKRMEDGMSTARAIRQPGQTYIDYMDLQRLPHRRI